MEHKSQHWIPRTYLEPWCDSNRIPANAEPYVWCFPKKGGTGKRKAPHNLFEDSDFYTILRADGERDLSLEDGLAVLENRFRPIRALIEGRQRIGDRDKAWLCGFVAAMHWRTRSQRDAFRQQWGHVVTVAEDLQQALGRMTPGQRQQHKPITPLGGATGPSLTVDDARRLSAQPLQHMLVTAIEEDLSLLAQMNLVVFTTDDELGFITSDHPCAYFDPHGGSRPPMLQSRTIEVTLPVSPRSLLLLCWEDLAPYRAAALPEVDNANRLQSIACAEYIVVRRDETKPVWFI